VSRLGTRAAVPLLVLAALAGFAAWGFRLVRHGFSARDNPSALEAYAARSLRRMATPASARRARNPFTATPELLSEARAHFADHCATCHGNDGSGETEIGQNLYPRAPDMRLRATQHLTDGEIYYIIHNGIRLTGMPAWGEAGKVLNDDDSWKLVLFIRHLPQITAQELAEMRNLNPRSPAEFQQEQEEEKFLNEGVAPAPHGHMQMHH